MTGSLSYRDAGVDLAAARAHTDNIAGALDVDVAGFAGAVALPAMRHPLLVTCTDGVGTKLLLAQELGDLSGLGQDLVAMCVNDLVCTGARPLSFVDYLAMGRLDPDLAGELVRGIAAACRAVGCALVGGETAELPGLYRDGHFDLAGAATGVVERDEALDPGAVRPGDAIVGIASSGLHSNGFSLVRALIAAGALAADPILLTPTRLYVADVLGLLDAGVPVRAAAHITGGGFAENLPRALAPGTRARIDPARWPRGAAIESVMASGRVSEGDAWQTFNMGIGMCLILPATAVADALDRLAGAWVIGEVIAGPAGVERG